MRLCLKLFCLVVGICALSAGTCPQGPATPPLPRPDDNKPFFYSCVANSNLDRQLSDIDAPDYQTTYKGVELLAKYIDITTLAAGVITNAANNALAYGGGIAGAISKAAGPSAQSSANACLKSLGKKSVPVGSAILTGSGNLKKQGIVGVINAVGPRCNAGEDIDLVKTAVTKTLALADQQGIASVAIPAISGIIFGCTLKEVIDRNVAAALDYIDNNPRTGIKQIVYVNYVPGINTEPGLHPTEKNAAQNAITYFIDALSYYPTAPKNK